MRQRSHVWREGRISLLDGWPAITVTNLVLRAGLGCISMATDPAYADIQQSNLNGIMEHGRMEGPYKRGISRGWEANCYGENVYEFSEDSVDAHSGKFAQRMVCRRYRKGGVQLRHLGIQVEVAKYYTISLWLRGTTRSRVYVGIRKNEMPYTSYVSNRLQVTNTWRPYIVIGKAPITDTSCGLYIMMADTGEILIDDVNIAEGNNRNVISSAFQIQKGNLIYNSGFEVGSAGWVPENNFLLSQIGTYGGSSYAVVWRTGIEAQPIPVTSGKFYTVSAYLRALRPTTSATLRFFEWADDGTDQPKPRDEIDTTIVLSTQWQRCSVSGYVVPLFSSMYVFHLSSSDTVCLDNVQVEEGALTEYSPMRSVEIGLDTPTRWCIIGDTVCFTISTVSALKGRMSLRYKVADLWNSTIESGERIVISGFTDTLILWTKRTGILRLIVQDTESGCSRETWVGVFPRDSASRCPLLGTHFTPTSPHAANAFLASEAMGAGFVRLHDFGDFCHWYRVEPQKGNFVWHDEQIRALRKKGFEIIANLGLAPLWAARDDSLKSTYSSGWTNALPRDTSEWKEYVAQVVQHYKPHIRYWEIWNEPYGKDFFNGSPEQYGRLLGTAYRVIKEIDPGATVLGGSFSPSREEWTQSVLANHALDFMDAVSYHEYWTTDVVEVSSTDTIPAVMKNANYLMTLLKEYGQPKPLFMTEGGVRSPSFDLWVPEYDFPESAHDAAATLVKGIVEMLSTGVSKVCYYFSGYGQGASPWYSTMVNGSTVLLDYAGRPKPTMMAYSALAHALGDAVPIMHITTSKFFCYFYRSKRSAETRGVLWSAEDRILDAGSAELADMMGNALTKACLVSKDPVFFRTREPVLKYASYLRSRFSP